MYIYIYVITKTNIKNTIKLCCLINAAIFAIFKSKPKNRYINKRRSPPPRFHSLPFCGAEGAGKSSPPYPRRCMLVTLMFFIGMFNLVGDFFRAYEEVVFRNVGSDGRFSTLLQHNIHTLKQDRGYIYLRCHFIVHSSRYNMTYF